MDIAVVDVGAQAGIDDLGDLASVDDGGWHVFGHGIIVFDYQRALSILKPTGHVKGVIEKMQKRIGARLRGAREGCKMTLREAGGSARVNYSTLSTWETGRAMPPADAVVRLASVYGVSHAALLGYDEQLFGLRLVHEWPEGLREFGESEWAEQLKLRPWEVGILASIGLVEGTEPSAGNWATTLLRWRMGHEDLTGMKDEDEVSPAGATQE